MTGGLMMSNNIKYGYIENFSNTMLRYSYYKNGNIKLLFSNSYNKGIEELILNMISSFKTRQNNIIRLTHKNDNEKLIRNLAEMRKFKQYEVMFYLMTLKDIIIEVVDISKNKIANKND